MSARAPARLITARRVVLSRPVVAFGVVAAIGLAITAVTCLPPSLWSHPVALFTLLLALAGLIAILVPAVTFWNLVRVPGALWVHGGTLLWNGAPLFARSEVEDAIAYRNGRTCGVRVRSRFRSAFFEVADLAEADEIVLALGKDTRQATVGVRGVAGRAFALSGVMAMLVLPLPWTLRVVLLLALLLAPAIFALLRRSQWVVGADGLLVRPLFGASRFVPYTEILRVEVAGQLLEVTTRDAVSLTLTLEDDAHDSSRPVVGIRALERRILQAKEQAAARIAEVPAILERGDRDVGAWLEELRRLTDRPATYRVASVPREQLWSALEDVTLPADVRAAAGAALGARLADEDRPRLRVAAAACASPELRIALEAAEEGDEERMAEALAAVATMAKGAER